MAELSNAQKNYLLRQKHHRRRVLFCRVALILFFLALWETAAGLGWIDAFIFSSPSRIVGTAASMGQDGSIFRHTGITLLETLASFFLTVILGLATAILLWWSPSVSEVLEPYLVVLNSLPKSALAPLLIVWLGANMRTIITAGVSVAIFGMILNLYTGFQQTDPEKIKLIRTLQGNRRDELFKVVLPGTIPLFISILKVNIGLCLVGVIIGEFIASRKGLGFLIIYGSQVFKLDWVLMSIIILCLIAIGLYVLIHGVEKWYVKRL